ncbi:MAG: PorV/PorQ family protein [bacterium]|nr:PorV/PorQ family protein [bacterium]
MRWMIIIFCLLLVLKGNCFGKENSYSKAGKSAATFLKISVDARASGMGEAYVGLAEGVSCIYYNPAGLVQSKTREATFMHNAYFEGINHEFVGYVHPMEDMERVIGLGIIGLVIDDIPRKTKATLVDEGSFKSNDYCLIFSLGQKIKEDILGGLSLKIIHQKLDNEKGLGAGIDVGLLYKNYPTEKINIGIVLQNIGQKIKIYKEKFTLPIILKVGIAYRLPNDKLLLVADLKKPYDNEASIHLGLEYRVLESIFLRGGFRYKFDNLKNEPLTDLTCGAGFVIKDFRLDYAFIPYDKFEDTHRISLTRSF